MEGHLFAIKYGLIVKSFPIEKGKSNDETVSRVRKEAARLWEIIPNLGRIQKVLQERESPFWIVLLIK